MKPVIKIALLFIIATALLSGCSKSVDDQLAQAERFLTEGQLTKAKKIYDDLATDSPEMPYALFGEAMIDEYYGYHWEAMVKQLDAAKMDSGYYPAMKAFTRVALHLGFVEKADKMGLLMIQRQPQNPESYLFYGQVELAKNRFDPARTNINTAAKMTDDQTLINLAKAEVALHTGGERARNDAFASIAQLNLRSAQHFKYLASIFNYLNMNDSARHYIKQGIALDDANMKLKLDLAQYYYDDGFTIEGLEVIDEITSRAEFYGPAYELGAYLYMARKNSIEADKMHVRFAQLEKDSPIWIEKLADMHSYFETLSLPAANYQAAYVKATNLLYPDDYLKQVYDKLMDAVFAEHDYAGAIDFYLEGQERFPDDSLAYFWASELSHRFPEDTGSAKYDPENLLEKNWKDIFWLEHIGRMFARTKRQDLAIKIYGHLVTHPRAKLESFTTLLDLLTRQKDSTKIDQLATIIPFRFQNNFQLTNKFLAAYKATGQRPKELKQAQKLYDQSPGSIYAIETLASLLAIRDKKAALDLFAKFSASYPKDTKGYYLLAKFEFDNGLTDSVLNRIDKVLELYETHGPALELKGLVFQIAGNTDSMVFYFNKAIKSGGPVPEAYYNMAQFHFEAGKDLDLAAGMGMGAVRYFDRDPRGYLILGQIYYAQKKYKMARTQFYKGTTLDPSQGELFFYMGKTDFMQKNNRLAKNALKQALDLGLSKDQTAEAKKMLAKM